MALTDTAIRTAKARETLYKLSDGRGLQLHVTTQASKLWRWAYRFDGKQKLMALGVYPDVTLAQARDKADQARKLLATGADPMAQRKAQKVSRRLSVENSFAAVAALWYAGWKAARSDSHTVYVWRRLEADVFPAIGGRPIAEIEAPELVAMMKKIEKRGALDIAKRALQTSSQIFRYAIAHGLGFRSKSRITLAFAGALFLSLGVTGLGITLDGIDSDSGLALSRNVLMVERAERPVFFWVSAVAFVCMSVAILSFGLLCLWSACRPRRPRAGS